jgi:alpha-ketoglutarate-dependent taurine dioxygenase
MCALQRSQSVAIDLDIRPLAGRIGAQIDNIRLAGDLPDAVIAAIEAALAKYKVIFFPQPGASRRRRRPHQRNHVQNDEAGRIGSVQEIGAA